jgi:hypothetical protein
MPKTTSTALLAGSVLVLAFVGAHAQAPSQQSPAQQGAVQQQAPVNGLPDIYGNFGAPQRATPLTAPPPTTACLQLHAELPCSISTSQSTLTFLWGLVSTRDAVVRAAVKSGNKAIRWSLFRSDDCHAARVSRGRFGSSPFMRSADPSNRDRGLDCGAIPERSDVGVRALRAREGSQQRASSC